jgi:hypothetical protein
MCSGGLLGNSFILLYADDVCISQETCYELKQTEKTSDYIRDEASGTGG